MAPEIEILKAAARRGYAVVEKQTNVLWSAADLDDPYRAADFAELDSMGPADPHCAITGLFPGCLQQGSRPPRQVRVAVGGQRHQEGASERAQLRPERQPAEPGPEPRHHHGNDHQRRGRR